MTKNIDNPCQKKCFISEEDICYGCFRSLQDIISWKEVRQEEKEAILYRAKERKEASEPKKYYYAFQI